MTFTETMEWQYVNKDKIGRLAKLGDKLALRLIQAYRALYANRTDVYLQSEWLSVADDFCRRDLTLTTRTILQNRYGHKIPRDLKRMDS